MECIRSRASVRKFQSKPVPGNVVDEILGAGIAAPSAGNSQDWELIVVKEPGNRSRLAVAAMGQGMIEDAPVVVVVCSNLKKISSYGTRGETLYTIQDAAAAAQNIMLAAWDREIGSCWVGAFDEADVARALALPSHLRPMAIIPMGYPAEKPRKPERWPLRDFVHWEKFKEKV
jgi:nitroreductase